MDIKKITFAILIISIGSAVAQILNIITVWQMIVINVASMIMMMVIVIIFMYKIRKMIKTGSTAPSIPDVKVIIPKAQIDNTLIPANSDILKKNIIPTNPFRWCVIRISMEINESIEQLGISAVRLRDYKTTENTIKKKLVAKSIYTIDTIVGPNETLNFKFDKDTNIKNLLIEELYIP